jgi:hypothetical protein
MSTSLEPSLQPSMAIDAPRTMNGEQIVDAVCLMIADRLSRDCNLRWADSYRSFSVRARVDVWLQDVDVVEVNADLSIGPAESAPPSRTVTMAVGAAADQVAGSLPQSLERFVDGAGAAEDAAAPKEKRVYVSRIRGSK